MKSNTTRVSSHPAAIAITRPDIDIDIKYSMTDTLSPIASWKFKQSETKLVMI
jgi:hypothetical protein